MLIRRPIMKLEEILKTGGPMLASKARSILAKHEGISDVTARKRISRMGPNILRLTSIGFPKGSSFLCLRSHNRAEIQRGILNTFHESRCIHGVALDALWCLCGEVTVEKFHTISASPHKRRGKKGYESVLQELCNQDFVKMVSRGDGKFVQILFPVEPISLVVRNARVIRVLEELLLAICHQWLQKNGIGSYNKIKHNGQFAGYSWDLTAPSYLDPLRTFSKKGSKPGFVVLDILPQYKIQKAHIEYFIRKKIACQSQRNVLHFLPILVGNSFEPEAFKYGKANGILLTTPENLFGAEVAKTLIQLANLLGKTATDAESKSAESILSLIERVAKIEGKSLNIRGQLFEFVVSHIVSNINPGIIEVGKVVHNREGKIAEIDVFSLINRQAIECYECKGHHKNIEVTEDEIKKWFEKISVIYKWIKDQEEHSSKEISFHFWTTGPINIDAGSFLRNRSLEIKKYKILWKSGMEVIQEAKRLNLGSIVKVLNEHYVKDQIS